MDYEFWITSFAYDKITEDETTITGSIVISVNLTHDEFIELVNQNCSKLTYGKLTITEEGENLRVFCVENSLPLTNRGIDRLFKRLKNLIKNN